MSEPVRQIALNDRPGRAQPGPLRDWLASMKATPTVMSTKSTITVRPAPEPAPEAWPVEAKTVEAETVEAVTTVETAPVSPEAESEGPAQVIPVQMIRSDAFLPEPLPPQVAPALPPLAPTTASIQKSPSRVELTRDLSELMAENLMLKSQLRLENERFENLQSMLADELRGLRGDAESDLKILDAVCAERDQLKSLTANAARKMHEMSARIESEVAQLAEARSERDLWMARAEALAQPLFQRR